MCILLVKPAGVKAPSLETFKICWDNNPDGAGIAYADGSEVKIEKGFMEWADFKVFFESIDLTDLPALIHFRIATHGTVKAENTHPFTVNKNVVAAHNGILSGVSNEGDWTDSETFFKRICAPILRSYKISSKVFHRAVQAIIGSSKLAFLESDGQLTIFGKFIEDAGMYFSNDSYLKSKFKISKNSWADEYNSYRRYNYYDDYEYDALKKEFAIKKKECNDCKLDSEQPQEDSDAYYDMDTYAEYISDERGWGNITRLELWDFKTYSEECEYLMDMFNASYEDASAFLDNSIEELKQMVDTI